MPTIPPYAIGKHITSVLLTPQAIDTAGVLSDTTPTRQFFSHLQDVDLDIAFTMENISAMDRPYANYVPIEEDHTVRLTELELYNGTNLAAAAAFGSTYYKFLITRGGQGFTGYGVLASYKMTGTKPKVTGTLELKSVDPGGTVALIYG